MRQRRLQKRRCVQNANAVFSGVRHVKGGGVDDWEVSWLRETFGTVTSINVMSTHHDVILTTEAFMVQRSTLCELREKPC